MIMKDRCIIKNPADLCTKCTDRAVAEIKINRYGIERFVDPAALVTTSFRKTASEQNKQKMEIPAGCKFPNATKLTIDAGMVESIDNLGQVMPRLQILDAQRNGLTTIDGNNLPRMLTRLKLDGNPIKQFINTQNLKFLSELSLANAPNTLDITDVASIESLTELNLSGKKVIPKTYRTVKRKIKPTSKKLRAKEIADLRSSLRANAAMVEEPVQEEPATYEVPEELPSDICARNYDSTTKTMLLTHQDLDAVPECITQEPYKSMKTLSIVGNNIKDIFMVNDLDDLEELYAGDNKINEVLISGYPLPHASIHLPKLKIIDLSNNEIDRMSGFYGLKKLKTLNLRGNQISSTIPMGLSNEETRLAMESLANLESIDLSSNDITGDISNLGELKSLRNLDLRGNIHLKAFRCGTKTFGPLYYKNNDVDTLKSCLQSSP